MNCAQCNKLRAPGACGYTAPHDAFWVCIECYRSEGTAMRVGDAARRVKRMLCDGYGKKKAPDLDKQDRAR